jgi:hypothetical protein
MPGRNHRNQWPEWTGIDGRLAPESVAGFDRNQWPDSTGIHNYWERALATQAALVWRAPDSFSLPALLPDGSYLSELRPRDRGGARQRAAIPVRVVRYHLPQVEKGKEVYRLVTNILEPERAPADELAVLYHERWEIETAFDEFKTHMKGGGHLLRSKTPELVLQEVWGFLLAHAAIRSLMQEAAVGALPRARDPDTVSFVHALRVNRRTLPRIAAIPPSGPDADG